MQIRPLASLSAVFATSVLFSAALLGSAQAGGPGLGGFGGPGHFAPGGFGPGKIGRPGGFDRPGLAPGWGGPGRFGQFGKFGYGKLGYGKPWRGPFGRGFYNQPYAGVWGNPWQNGSQTTVYTVPETQRFEIAPELPVVTGGYQPAPVGAPVLYVINAPRGQARARVVDVGSVKAIGAPIIGPDGDQTPHIVELIAR